MDADIRSDYARVVGFEVSVPEIELQLLRVFVLRQVKGLDYLDCLNLTEGQVLTSHFFNKKLDVLLLPISNAAVEAAEYRS